MKSSLKPAPLLFLEDCGVAVLLAFCVDAFFCKRKSLTILGGHAGSGRDDFPSLFAGGFHCVGVNALPRNRIPIWDAGNRIVLAVVVVSVLSIDMHPFRIRDVESALRALSYGSRWQL